VQLKTPAAYLKFGVAMAVIGAIAAGAASLAMPRRYVSTAVLRSAHPLDTGAALGLRLKQQQLVSRNSLSEMMIKQLRAALDEPNARVIIIGAHGPAFSSGHNLKEITSRRTDADEGRNFFKRLFDQCTDLMLAITNKPTTACAHHGSDASPTSALAGSKATFAATHGTSHQSTSA